MGVFGLVRPQRPDRDRAIRDRKTCAIDEMVALLVAFKTDFNGLLRLTSGGPPLFG